MSLKFPFHFFCSHWIHNSQFKCTTCMCLHPSAVRSCTVSCSIIWCVCVCLCADGWRSSRKRIGRRRAVTWLWQHFRFKKKGKEGLEHQMRADACWGFGRLRTSRTPPPPRCRLQHGQERRISSFFNVLLLLLLLFHRCDNNLLPSSPANLKPLTYLFFFFFLWCVHHHTSSEEARPHTHTSPLVIPHEGKREQLFQKHPFGYIIMIS